MPDQITNLAPPLTPAQMEKNAAFQSEMRARFALSANAPTRSDYIRQYISDTFGILRILQDQFETASTETGKGALAAKARQMKLDICHWLVAQGNFAEAESLCPDEAEREKYRKYTEAENCDDARWCDHHPRYIEGASGKPQINYYREFDYFSGKRGRLTAMTRCSQCEFRNAVDAPADLLELDRQRQIIIDNFKQTNP